MVHALNHYWLSFERFECIPKQVRSRSLVPLFHFKFASALGFRYCHDVDRRTKQI